MCCSLRSDRTRGRGQEKKRTDKDELHGKGNADAEKKKEKEKRDEGADETRRLGDLARRNAEKRKLLEDSLQP